MEAKASDILFKVFGLPVTGHITTMWAVTLVLLVLCLLVSRRMRKVPGRLQCLAEYALEGMLGYFAGMMGREKARRYFPLIMTLFLFILFSNWSGLLPFAGHVKGFRAPTSTWSVTAALAIIVFFSIQVAGFKEKGWGYLKHFFQPMPVMFFLNIIEELVRPLSLSLRLFGNIFGGETVAAVLLTLAPIIPVPMQLLDVLFGFIQALVFTTLTAIFIGQATADSH